MQILVVLTVNLLRVVWSSAVMVFMSAMQKVASYKKRQRIQFRLNSTKLESNNKKWLKLLYMAHSQTSLVVSGQSRKNLFPIYSRQTCLLHAMANFWLQTVSKGMHVQFYWWFNMFNDQENFYFYKVVVLLLLRWRVSLLYEAGYNSLKANTLK